MDVVEPRNRDLDTEAVADELPDVDEETFAHRERPVAEPDRPVDPGEPDDATVPDVANPAITRDVEGQP